MVGYTVQYRVISGEMHGFYFSGNSRLEIDFIYDKCYALDDSGNKYGLSIKNVDSDKWDIILADGKGVSRGNLTYFFYFNTDFSKAGYLAKTITDENQKLIVLNWSPVQWDEAYNQDHYSLEIITPFNLPANINNIREYIDQNKLILTEPWMNTEYRIDYKKSNTGKLKIIFYKKNPGNYFHMRTQFYMPQDWFDTTIQEYVESNEEKSESEITPNIEDTKIFENKFKSFKSSVFIWISIIFVIFFIVILFKQRSMIKAHKSLDEIDWSKLDWTPPLLVLSQFQKPGKICRPGRSG